MVRKWFGHDHIPRRFAPEVNRFAQGTLSPFLNFHRPCLFATEHRDGNGRIRRIAGDVMTPYARLRSIPGAEEMLKPGLGFELDAAAVAETDLEAARRVQAPRTVPGTAPAWRRPRRRMTPSRGAGRRGGPLAARAGMAPAGDTMNLTEPDTDDSGAPSPPAAWGRWRPSRVRFAGQDASRSLANPGPTRHDNPRQ